MGVTQLELLVKLKYVNDYNINKMPRYFLNFVNRFLYKKFFCSYCEEEFSATVFSLALNKNVFEFVLEPEEIYTANNFYCGENPAGNNIYIRFLQNNKFCQKAKYPGLGNCCKVIEFSVKSKTKKRIKKNLYSI